MNSQTVKLDINNLQEEYIFNKVAKQASGAVMYKQKDAVLIAAVAIDETPVQEDFLPLTVQYIEKAYAAAKIPGGFVKRESRPGEFEMMTSRIIDRSLRPLFPSGFHFPVNITITVVSADNDVDMQIAALHAANAALFVSDIPVSQTIAAVRLSMLNNEIQINSPLSLQVKSTLDLLVVGSNDDVLMIEMGSKSSLIDAEHSANECSDEELVELISQATSQISKASSMYESDFAKFVANPLELTMNKMEQNNELYQIIKEQYHDEVLLAIAEMSTSERSTKLSKLLAKIESQMKCGEETKSQLEHTLHQYKKDVVRDMILDRGIRADGRGLDEVRQIDIETNILPSAHGSTLFTRGQTQALVVATLGDKRDAQMYELITSSETQNENFMVHYNFPPYSVGEAKPVGPASRRELGHGNLAKRALEPTIMNSRDNTIRLVSEILESNGSSSMATICGGSLALRASNVKTNSLVAGVAMGLILDNDRHAVLTDIMGLEDHDGDMDFKIAGTANGTTAMQMDIKLGGISLELLREALAKASKAKMHILNLMEESASSIVRSKALPIVESFMVDSSQVGAIIGKGGSVIREIIEEYSVSIDLGRDNGEVKITGQDIDKVQGAKDHILKIVDTPTQTQMNYEIGKTYKGKIKRLVDFGLFVEMPDGFDALLHISKISQERVTDLSSRYNEGDDIDVVVLEQAGKKVELATASYASDLI